MMTVEDLQRLGAFRSKQQVYSNVTSGYLPRPALPGRWRESDVRQAVAERTSHHSRGASWLTIHPDAGIAEAAEALLDAIRRAGY
jgi:predicted DNA-binding transcriptional regulator AlpA